MKSNLAAGKVSLDQAECSAQVPVFSVEECAKVHPTVRKCGEFCTNEQLCGHTEAASWTGTRMANRSRTS